MNLRLRLATALRVVAAAALVVAAGVTPVRLVAHAFDPFAPYPGHTTDYGVARARAIDAVMPSIADRPENVVLVFGSSGVARAFVPAVFDDVLARTGKRYVSFNLAQLLLQPETALAMAKDLRATFEAAHKRSAITLFGVSVAELSRGSLAASRRTVPDQAFAFVSADVLASRARTDPLGAIGDGFERLAFGNVRPERVGQWLDDALEARPPACNSGLKQPPEGPEAYAALVDFCTDLQAQFPRGVPPWNQATRGAIDFGLPTTRPALERLVAHQPASITAPAPAATPLPFDPSLPAPDDPSEDAVQMIIAALREVGAVSDTTLVLRDILNPAMVAGLTPRQIARWRQVAERIARDGNARLLDMNDGAITAADFGDRTHLNPLAAERFSALLATRLRPMVQEDHASR